MDRLLLSCVVVFVMLALAPVASGQGCSIAGTGSADRLAGTAGDDVVCGLAGADRLRGENGADRLLGAAGGDLLQGRAGDDRLLGGAGADGLFGGAGADDLRGGPGRDGLGGGFGPDELRGGPGSDVAYYGQRGRPVRVSIGRGADDGVTGEGDDVHADVEEVRGGRGDDVLVGNGGANRLLGGGGSDRLRGGGGNDALIGGAGSDRLEARDGGGFADHVACGDGDDSAVVDPGDVVEPDCERVTGAATPLPGDPNRPPAGLALSNASVAENEPAGTVLGALSAEDPDSGDAHSFALVAGPGSDDNGAFQVVGSSLRTAAAFDYETRRSYTVRIRAADSGTPAGEIARAFTITVADAPEPASADARAATTAEETPTTITLSASDPEGDGPLTFATSAPSHGSLSAPANVTCTPNGCTAEVDYTPAANFDGADSFTYTASDSLPATVSITVDPVNDAPVNTLPAGPVVALRDADEPIGGISVADVDAAAVRVTLSVPNGSLTLSTLVPGGVSPLQVTDNGTGTVVAEASPLAINTTFADANGLVYRGTAMGPAPLTVTSDDLGGTGSGGSLTDTDTLALIVDTPPVAAAQAVATDEDTAETITLSASDADGDDPLTFAIAAAPTHGSLGPIGSVTCSHAVPNVCTADVTYTPAANATGPDSFTFTAADAFVGSAPATVGIAVDAVNDVPRLEGAEAGALAYTENAPATLLTATTTVSDLDSADFDTGTLTVEHASGGTADDHLEITSQGQITVSGSTVSHGGTTIGTFTGGAGTTPLVVTLDADATAQAVQALIRAVAYRNVSDAPSSAARTVRFVLADGDGGTSAPAVRSVTVAAVDDLPALAAVEPGALAYTENDPAAPVSSTLTVSDPDSDVTGATVTIDDALAQDVLSFADQLGITGAYSGGVLTLTGNASAAAYQTALRAVTYRNTSEDPSTLTRTVTFAVQGGNAQSRDVTVAAVNDAPVADDESFEAVGNTALVVDDPTDGAPGLGGPRKSLSGDILAGDTDVDSGALTVQPVSGQATADGGRVTVEADGDFTYFPAAGTSCTDTSDSFDYTVSDQDGGTDSGRVTVTIAGCVWYVDADAAGNSGSSDAPFDTLGQAEAASAAGHTVFVFDGGYGGDGYAMNAGERLIGEHDGLVVGGHALHPANAGARPTVTATGADVVALDDGNEVRGLVLDPQGTGGGIAGAAGDTGGTIDDVQITDTGAAGTQPGLELDGTAGTFEVTDLVVDNGVRLINAGTTDFGTTTINSSGLLAHGTDMGTSSFSAVTSAGVSLTDTSGSTTFGDLALTATFSLDNAGTVSVPAAGTANINATGAPAVDVGGTSGTLAFDNVSSANSAGDGINLAGPIGFSASGGSISGAAGIAFDVEGGNGTITYPGALSNGSGQTAEITGRTGGAVTLGGAIADTNDAGGGIVLSGNTGGTTTFSGASKVLNTGTADAVLMTSSDGHTLAFPGGGLDIDATSGRGLEASGSGTLVVSGAGNTIDTTTGRALNVSNTAIGAADVTFQRISSNGAAGGILLDSTGAAGSLVVTGNGGTCTAAVTTGCTGGEIRNASGADNSGSTPPGTGVVLKDTTDPSLTRVWIHDHSNYGIRGTNVAGFTLANSVVNGTNGTNATTPFDDSSVWFTNLTGSASVSDTAISGGFEDNFRVNNTSGSLNRITFTSVAMGLHSVSDGNDSLSLQSQPTAGQLHATVQNSTFTGARGDQIDYQHNGTGTGDLDLADNTFTNTHPQIATGGGGLTLSNNGTSGNTTMDILRNSFQGAVGPGVLIVKTIGPATQTGTFANNTIGVAGTANSGSREGSALKLQTVDQGSSNWSVTGNQIRGYNNFGIEVLAGGGSNPQSGAVNTTITGNTIAEPGTTPGTITIPKNGVHLNIGTFPGDTFQACAVISGNNLADSGADSVPSTINADVRLRQRQSTTIRLPGYAGGATDETAVQNFVAANNLGGPDVLAGPSGSGGGFIGTGTTCP